MWKTTAQIGQQILWEQLQVAHRQLAESSQEHNTHTKLLIPFFDHIHVSLGLVTTLFLAADLKSYTHCNPPKSSAHLPSCNFIFCQPVMRICVVRLNFRISYPTMSLESGHDRERWVGALWCKQHGHLGLAMKSPWLEPHSPFLLF